MPNSRAFWQAIFARYGTQATPQAGINNHGIAFELHNEPFLDRLGYSGSTLYNLMLSGGSVSAFSTNGATTNVAQAWTAVGYQTVINDAIAAGAQNVCIVNGYSYAASTANYASYMPTDSRGQCAVGWHTYPNGSYPATGGYEYPGTYPDTGYGTSAAVLAPLAVIQAGIPLLITEDGGQYGPTATSGEPHVDFVTDFADAAGISYLAWEFWAPVSPSANGNNNLVTTGLTPTVGQGVEVYKWMSSFAASAGVGAGGAPTAPQVPTIVSVVAGNGQVIVNFISNGDGGSPITSFLAYTDTGYSSIPTTASPAVIQCPNGAAVTVQLTATNAIGTSDPAGPSASVTPSVGAGGTGFQISNSALPQGTAGTAYSDTITAINGVAPITYGQSGEPGAFSFNTATGALTASSPVTGVTAITFTATDNSSSLGGGAVNQTATKTLSLTIIGTATVPGAPTVGTLTAGNGEVFLSFTPPASNGGSPITLYTAITNTGHSGSSTASPITITGTPNGTAVTATAEAINLIGNSTSSGVSNSATPSAGGGGTGPLASPIYYQGHFYWQGDWNSQPFNYAYSDAGVAGPGPVVQCPASAPANTYWLPYPPENYAGPATNGVNFNLAGFTYFTVAVKPGASGGYLNMSFYRADGPTTDIYYGIFLNITAAPYGPASPVAGQWNVYKVPLADFAMTGYGTWIYKLILDQQGTSPIQWEFDQMGFI